MKIFSFTGEESHEKPDAPLRNKRSQSLGLNQAASLQATSRPGGRAWTFDEGA